MRSYSLNRPETRTLTLPGGGSITYRALTVQSFDACKTVARKKKAELLGSVEGLQALGLTPEDIENEELSASLFMGYLIGEIGARHITAWTAVADETGEKDAEVTPENARKFLKHPIVAANFYADVMMGLQPEIDKKKGSPTDADGNSAEAQPIAPAALPREAPAPRDVLD